MIKVMTDMIPKKAQDELEAILLGWNFPWYHYANTNYASQITQPDDVPQFTHGFIRENASNSQMSHIPLKLLDLIGVPKDNLLRVKANLLMREPEVKIHPPHTDDDREHIAFIYYVNESDGDTHFYEGDKIIKTVSPKKGSGVFFNGSIFHASASPVNTRYRIVLNYNLAPGDYIDTL